jgi:hypothetical protein
MQHYAAHELDAAPQSQSHIDLASVLPELACHSPSEKCSVNGKESDFVRVICSHYCVLSYHDTCSPPCELKVGRPCPDGACLGTVIKVDCIRVGVESRPATQMPALTPPKKHSHSYASLLSVSASLEKHTQQPKKNANNMWQQHVSVCSSPAPSPPLIMHLLTPPPASRPPLAVSQSAGSGAELFARGMSKFKELSSQVKRHASTIGGQFKHAKKLFAVELGVDLEANNALMRDQKEQLEDLMRVLDTYKGQVATLQQRLHETSSAACEAKAQHAQESKQLQAALLEKDNTISQMLWTQLKLRTTKTPSSTPLVVSGDMFANLSSQQLEEAQNYLLLEQKSRKTCVVCLDNPAQVLFLPCRHMRVCVECSDRQKEHSRCPICRDTVTEKIIPFQ